ncbi:MULTISPECIES: YciI family protein [Pseudomonas aeruginosa group]|uniref:YciI family protein n=3 Tax=Pseudomonas aeruginosa group TaxID=136841 RepID=A0ABD7K7N6_PSEAI|nr:MULTISPECIES: YciI family protein [Pseudomonas aeruginosa group]VTS63676.1 YciI-like protein [Streptococcus dysgalactiae subsp. equisimilis]ABR82085.1 ycii-related domain superfamily [Pseudomonas aeruginosa PA7]AVK04002.1 YCII-related domain protein [Pseudomonas paraeruginosa]AVR68698.1 YciI family protein [Pseudomonas paraeruginosa]AWE94222.1 YCII-related domain protein [Pseudomonas paraeruginosa]
MNRYFAVFATDHPRLDALRRRVRPAHRAHLRNPSPHRVVVRLGGPTLDDCDGRMNGTLLVIEAASLDEVEAFLADDPYVRAGLFERVEIRPWSWSLGAPEALP